MGDNSTIEWTDASWNPVTGCSKVSPGCAHCYAESLTLRFAKPWGAPELPWTPQNAEANVILHPERLRQPLAWTRPRMIFVNSMSDLFHEQVPDEFIAEVFSVMAAASHHIFQVLTKRPERMRDVVRGLAWELPGDGSRGRAEVYVPHYGIPATPLPNVWLGTSIENRRFVHRADELRATPAAVRFISAEPLLGPLVWDAGDGLGHQTSAGYVWNDYTGPQLNLSGIDWLIAGGESGPTHRPCHRLWVTDLRDAALANGTAFFFKQWGGRTPKAGGRELDGRTWDEMPDFVGGGASMSYAPRPTDTRSVTT